MASDLKQPKARPVFRWLAGLTCPVFAIMAVVIAFPGVVGFAEKPSYFFAMIMLWGALVFGPIAATGRVDGIHNDQMRLLLAAKKYVSGKITLEEYGAETKRLLGD